MSDIPTNPPIKSDVLQQLLRFAPPQAVSIVNKAMPSLLQLFEQDRHFQLETELKKMYAELDGVEISMTGPEAEPPMKIEYVENARSEGRLGGKAIASVQGLRILMDFLKSSRLSREGMTKAEEGRETLNAITDNSTWSKVRVDNKGHGTYYRSEPGLGSHSFKVVGIVKQGVVPLASVLMELDMYNEWFPFCNHAEELGDVSRFHKLSRFAIKVPWPLADREVAIGGYGVDVLENNLIVIRAVSLPNDGDMPNGKPVPGVIKNNVRADLKMGGFVLEAISKTETKLAFVMNVDPKIPNIPIAVLNWVSGKMIWVLLYQINKAAVKATDPKSKYAQRRKERPEVYKYFEERAGEALGHLPETSESSS